MAEINEKYEGNYLGQGNNDFPLDCETLEYIAHNRRMAEMLGAIAGDKVILNGCVSGQSGRSSGYVFLKTQKYPNGEVLWFAGSTTQDTWLHVVEESVSVTSDGYQYPQAYSKRYLATGTGSERYKWADFAYLEKKTNRELAIEVNKLRTDVDALQGVPIGTVEMWAGQGDPSDGKYLICDGRQLLVADYKDLHDVIGDVFNSAKDMNGATYTTDNGYFRLPDLRGRFICGQTPSGEDSTKGTTGGEKTHTLTAAESGLPAHGHEASMDSSGAHNHSKRVQVYDGDGWATDDSHIATMGGTGAGSFDWTSGQGGAHTHTVTVQQNQAQNASQAHENRPPYYVLAYIIKALP
ncbi:MAG: tail fiber protein [Prevotella sp.]|nr:tail fiber protein [Prevotella sp.]